MPAAASDHGDLDAISSVDRVARAASLWLRREVACGAGAAPGTRAYRELAAGLVASLGERLGLDRAQTLLAGYAVALMASESDLAMDLPLRIVTGPGTADYARGVAAAEALMQMLTVQDRAAVHAPGKA